MRALRLFERGNSYSVIAAEEGVSRNAIASRIRRAREANGGSATSRKPTRVLERPAAPPVSLSCPQLRINRPAPARVPPPVRTVRTVRPPATPEEAAACALLEQARRREAANAHMRLVRAL